MAYLDLPGNRGDSDTLVQPLPTRFLRRISETMSTHHPVDLAVPVDSTDHTLGPDHAPVTVVEYGDFECPNCKQAAPAVKLLLERFPERVRFAYRHFPLEGP